MKIGTKHQYEKFKVTNAHNKELLDKIASMIEWASPEIYFIREAGDGEKEAKLLERFRTEKSASISSTLKEGETTKTVHNYVERPRPIARPSAVPHKQPPPFLAKAMQFLITVTGPRVIESVFKMRFNKCTVEGGLTFALLTGKITDISPLFIYINNVGVAYPNDETPIVKIGDEVQHGQTLTRSDVAKQCPLLNAKNGEYFCGGCGCGARKQAELKNKLYYARVTCPRTPPQFSAEDEDGPNIQRD